MKKLFTLIVCALAIGMVMPQEATAAKKEKKDKKAYTWEMPELSGNADVDTYLLKCDTIYNKIQQYGENITFYRMAEITVTQDDGSSDITYQIVDKDNNLRSSNLAFKQNMEIILAYPQIVLDMTDLATAQVAALAAAPSLGLGALKYGKYVKAGPKIIELGGKEMKEIYKSARAQAKQIKALKAGKIDDVKALNAEINAGSVDGGAASMYQITMTKAQYEEQFGKLVAEENANPIEGGFDIPEEVE